MLCTSVSHLAASPALSGCLLSVSCVHLLLPAPFKPQLSHFHLPDDRGGRHSLASLLTPSTPVCVCTLHKRALETHTSFAVAFRLKIKILNKVPTCLAGLISEMLCSLLPTEAVCSLCLDQPFWDSAAPCRS